MRRGNRALNAARGKTNNKDELLAAASVLMRERDSFDISLSEIALKSGVNSALVKYYFGNKEGLLLMLLERDSKASLSDLGKLLEMDLTSAQKMRRHIAGMINTFYRAPYLCRLLFSMINDSPPERSQDIADRFVKPLADAYKSIIDEGVRRGEFRPVDPKMFYFTAIGACDQLFSARRTMQRVFGVDEIDDELRKQYVDHTVRTLMSALLIEPKD
jgi:AcrR family transcriptional regulator